MPHTQIFRDNISLAPYNHYLEHELNGLLRADNTIFNFIEAGSLDGIWYWDLENPEHEWMSPRFWITLGYDPSTKKHLTSEWQDIIHPDDLKIAVSNFEKHKADPKYPYDQEVRYLHRDGHTVWVRCRGLIIRNSMDEPIRMIGAHNDITKHKALELSLREKIAELELAQYQIKTQASELSQLHEAISSLKSFTEN